MVDFPLKHNQFSIEKCDGDGSGAYRGARLAPGAAAAGRDLFGALARAAAAAERAGGTGCG